MATPEMHNGEPVYFIKSATSLCGGCAYFDETKYCQRAGAGSHCMRDNRKPGNYVAGLRGAILYANQTQKESSK